MTLAEIKKAVATYLNKSVSLLTVSGQDLSLVAMNQVRMQAELLNDFGFTRKLVTVSVDGVTGGSLDTAVEYGTSDPIDVKSVVDVGFVDVEGNFRPVDWTTAEDSLNIQRKDNPVTPRYPTDGQALSGPWGGQRFIFSGNKIMVFPQALNTTFTIRLVVHSFTADWTATDLTAPPDPVPANQLLWQTKGSQYIQWATVVQINQMFREYVFRQEGNLPPPQTLADQGLANLITWDTFKYEQFRRHSR